MGLVDNIDELKRANSSITTQLNIESIQSFIDDAVSGQILPRVGWDQYQFFVSGKGGFADDSEAFHALLLLQKAVVNFALAAYADFGALGIDDSGVFVWRNNDKLPASDKKVMRLRQVSSAMAYKSLEDALIFMEGLPLVFGSYNVSNERKANLSLFINFSKEMPQTVSVSADLFDSLRDIVRNTEENILLPLLSDTLFDNLKSAIVTRTLSPQQLALLSKLRRPLASLVMADGLAFNIVSLDAGGVYTLSEGVGGISGNVETRGPADLERIKMVIGRFKRAAESELEQLRKWMNNRLADYPGYTSSTTDVLANMNDDQNSSLFFI